MEVFSQDCPATHFGFVVEGFFRLQRLNPKGQRVIMDLVGPGGLVGTLLMAQPAERYPISVQSVGKGEFLKIPRSTFHQSWLKNAEIMKRTQIAQFERLEGIQSIRNWQRASLEEKIASLLLRWHPKLNQEFAISRTDVADTVGTTTESVIRVFSNWVSRGLIARTTGNRIVVDHEKLKTEVLHGEL